MEAYADDGTTLIATPLNINRKTGNAAFSGSITAGGNVQGASMSIKSATPVLGLYNAAGTIQAQLYSNGGTVFLANNVSGGHSINIRGDGYVIASFNAAKPGGGPWVDVNSDARVKDIHGPYEIGLAEVIALKPTRYEFKGNEVTGDDPDAPSSHAGVLGIEYVGLIAQEVETVFPGMVRMTKGFIDGEPVDDLRSLDTGPLIYALVNAVKELSARVTELEAARV
jgi:hypothetical protein